MNCLITSSPTHDLLIVSKILQYLGESIVLAEIFRSSIFRFKLILINNIKYPSLYRFFLKFNQLLRIKNRIKEFGLKHPIVYSDDFYFKIKNYGIRKSCEEYYEDYMLARKKWEIIHKSEIQKWDYSKKRYKRLFWMTKLGKYYVCSKLLFLYILPISTSFIIIFLNFDFQEIMHNLGLILVIFLTFFLYGIFFMWIISPILFFLATSLYGVLKSGLYIFFIKPIIFFLTLSENKKILKILGFATFTLGTIIELVLI